MPAAYSEAQTSSEATAKTIRVLGPVFVYFLAAGIATVMLGPLLPSLIQHWKILDAQAGALFTASFIGQLAGAWFAARNLRASILYGAALSAIGCLVMTTATFAAAHIALFAIGIGIGAGLTAGNIIVGTAIPTAGARLIALINVTWSIGAIACPVLVRLSSPGGTRLFFLITAAGLAIASLFAFTIPHSLQPSGATTALKPQSQRLPMPILPLFAFAAALLLYIGIENSIGGWLPSYAIRANASLQASSISFYFWTSELIGRLIIAALSIRIREATLYRLCLVLLISAGVLLCTTTHAAPIVTIALTSLSGLALAPLYPLIISFMLARTGNHPRLGPLFACASLGGASLPWLTGVVSTQFHGLRAGLIIPEAGACLLLSLSTIITSKPLHQTQEHRPA